MKKATSKILMAAMSLVVAIGIATGTTFAWFTSNRTVTVASVNATVTTGTDGLYVAIQDARGSDTFTKFGTTVDQADINKAIFGSAENLDTVVLDAVTSTDGKTFTDINSDAVTWSKDATKNAPNKFVEFKLKFRTTVAQDVFLAVNNGTDAEGSRSELIPVNGNTLNPVLCWREAGSDYGTELTKGAEIAARAANAARVSFESGANSKIWAPNEAKDESNTGNVGKGFWKGNVAEDYRQYFLNDTENAKSKASEVINQVTLRTDDEAKAQTNTGNATAIATTEAVNGNYEATVTVRLWIEGTDGDCLNSIFNDKLQLTLVFNSMKHNG